MTTGKENLLQSLLEAYLMEKGTREFYARAADSCSVPDARRTFEELSAWEGKHMDFLQYLYQAIMEDRDIKGFHDFRDKSSAPVVEGGIPVKDLEDELEKTPITGEMDAVTMALGIEGKAYALYWKLSKTAGDSNARIVFKSMMQQEIDHINYLKEMLARISESL